MWKTNIKNSKEIFMIPEFQASVDSIIEKQGGYWSSLSMLAALVEEVGELARLINAELGIKPQKSSELRSSMSEELGDCLFSLICIANSYNIDLKTSLDQVLEKFATRDKTRFSR